MVSVLGDDLRSGLGDDFVLVLGDDFSLAWSAWMVGSVETCFRISRCYSYTTLPKLTQLWKLSGA